MWQEACSCKHMQLLWTWILLAGHLSWTEGVREVLAGRYTSLGEESSVQCCNVTQSPPASAVQAPFEVCVYACVRASQRGLTFLDLGNASAQGHKKGGWSMGHKENVYLGCVSTCVYMFI